MASCGQFSIYRTESRRPSSEDVLFVNMVDATIEANGNTCDMSKEGRRPAVRFMEKLSLSYSPDQRISSDVAIKPLYLFTRGLCTSKRSEEAVDEKRADKYVRQYLMHLKGAFLALDQPAEIPDNGQRGSSRMFSLKIHKNVEFYFPPLSKDERELFRFVDAHYRLGRYPVAMDQIETRYCTGKFDTVVDFLEASIKERGVSSSEVAVGQAAMYAFLCHCQYPVDSGCPMDYFPLQRNTRLTKDQQEFLNMEKNRLARSERYGT